MEGLEEATDIASRKGPWRSHAPSPSWGNCPEKGSDCPDHIVIFSGQANTRSRPPGLALLALGRKSSPYELWFYLFIYLFAQPGGRDAEKGRGTLVLLFHMETAPPSKGSTRKSVQPLAVALCLRAEGLSDSGPSSASARDEAARELGLGTEA